MADKEQDELDSILFDLEHHFAIPAGTALEAHMKAKAALLAREERIVGEVIGDYEMLPALPALRVNELQVGIRNGLRSEQRDRYAALRHPEPEQEEAK